MEDVNVMCYLFKELEEEADLLTLFWLWQPWALLLAAAVDLLVVVVEVLLAVVEGQHLHLHLEPYQDLAG